MVSYLKTSMKILDFQSHSADIRNNLIYYRKLLLYFCCKIRRIFMEKSGNIPIFNIPGTLFRNILRNFSENFFRNMLGCLKGMFHKYFTNMYLPGGAISNIILMMNELDLLWLPSFIALGIYFIFGTKFSWNEGIDTCFNVECVLLGSNFDFLNGYLVVTARYLVVAVGYYSFSLLVWTEVELKNSAAYRKKRVVLNINRP